MIPIYGSEIVMLAIVSFVIMAGVLGLIRRGREEETKSIRPTVLSDGIRAQLKENAALATEIALAKKRERKLALRSVRLAKKA
jgi:hypothetical protein